MSEPEPIDCDGCYGHGIVKAQDASGKWHVYECPKCRGYGWVPSKTDTGLSDT